MVESDTGFLPPASTEKCLVVRDVVLVLPVSLAFRALSRSCLRPGEHMAEKPMSSIQRERYDGTGKRSCGNHSVRRRRSFERDAVVRTELTGGGQWSKESFPTNRSRLLTCVECEGTNCGFDNALTWEVLPALLEENAVGLPQVKRQKDGAVRSTYHLEAIMEQIETRRGDFAPSQAEKREERRRKQGHLPPRSTAIYELLHRSGSRRRRPSLFAEPPGEPPERVGAPLLAPRSLGGRGGKHRCAPLVRNDEFAAAFDCEGAGGVGAKRCYIELDLGANCELSDLSTQGRHPPTRTYPQIRHERREARNRARSLLRVPFGWHEGEGTDGEGDRYWVEGYTSWNLARDGQYEGPFWRVLSLGDANYHKAPLCRHQQELQWVSRYEVSIRAEGGRAWRSLGVFHGNDDATSEVAHSLHQYKGGIVARFVRFRPLEAVGGGAMRVGVYGRPIGGAADAAAANAYAADGRGGVGGRGAAAEADDELTLVTYELTTPSSTAHKCYVAKQGNSCRGCRCCWYEPPGRTQRKAAARADVSTALPQQKGWRAGRPDGSATQPES